jgi:hypothetical protein
MVIDTGSTYLFEQATLADPNPTYLAGGTAYTTPRVAAPYPRVAHDMQRDVVDDWNTVQVIVDGETSEFIVNGYTTFRSTARRQPDPAFPDDPPTPSAHEGPDPDQAGRTLSCDVWGGRSCLGSLPLRPGRGRAQLDAVPHHRARAPDRDRDGM